MTLREPEDAVELKLEKEAVDAEGAWVVGAENWEYADTDDGVRDKGAPSVLSPLSAVCPSRSVSVECRGVPAAEFDADVGAPWVRGGTNWTWRFRG